jgi:hypothetical protein
MSADVVVAAQTGPATWEAESFVGVPRVAPTTIIVAAAGDDVLGWITAIRDELRATLIASAPKVVASQLAPPTSADPREWTEFGGADRVGVLSLVCPATDARELSWYEDVIGLNNWSVLPIFRQGGSPASAFSPGPLRKLNATFWKTLATECVPAILARGGLTNADQRVFISYRRLETQPLADQLFDALTHEGFDVFVDRFTVPPGVDFQMRLDQELADKSMVILLESHGVPESKWTQHEIDFAKRYRLGLASLKMPDVSSPLPSIDKDYRFTLEKVHFEKGSSTTVSETKDRVTKTVEQWGALTKDDLANVVLWVKGIHDAALFRRRTYLRDSLNAALRQERIQSATLDDAGFMVTTQGQTKYAFWLTARSADVADFEIAHPRTLPPSSSTGLIVGLPAVETARQKRVTWLSGLCKLTYIEEDDLTEAAKRIKAGSL